MYATIKKSTVFHHELRSKTCKNECVLLIINYDYFLQKKDLIILLKKFSKVFLIPNSQTQLLIDTLNTSDFNIIEDKIKIIFNPNHISLLGSKFEVELNRNTLIEIQNVFDFCEKLLKKLYIGDDIYNTSPNVENLKYFGLQTRLLKKMIDWLGGVVLFICTLPFWFVTYIMTSIQSPGSTFFKQERVGIRNKVFKIFKFRSMYLDAEKDGAQFATKNDERIFPWGKTMRATRIDELPQLLNIIKGELSLVGPRPERRIFIDSFEENIPHYSERHVVKPGISGYAQIMYPYGSGVNDARHKLMYDLYYIKNWSILLEIKILIKTVITVIFKKGI